MESHWKLSDKVFGQFKETKHLAFQLKIRSWPNYQVNEHFLEPLLYVDNLIICRQVLSIWKWAVYTPCLKITSVLSVTAFSTGVEEKE